MTRPISRCIGVVLLIIGLLLGQPGYPTPDPVPTIVSAPVAVFPLHNATGDAGLDWVSIGLQDSLTVDLWYVSALHTQALPQMTESLRQVCPDPTLACVAGQDWATWQGPAKAQGYGGFLWGEYRRDGEALVLRLGWYGSEGATPLAEQTVRGSSLPELLTASSAGLQALLAARAIPLTDAEQARLRAPKTKVAAAWEQNALGYWEQIRHTLAADDAQRTVRAAAWEQHLRAAVQADPDYAEAWNNLGWQRYTMKIYKGEGAALSPTLGADVAFQQALRLKPEMIDALMGRGNALKAQEKPAEALPWYERAVALNPSLVGHRWVLLDAYLTAKRPEAGLAQLTVLDEHLKRHGRETERQALNDWRGRYHEALQQWPQALAAYAVWDADLARQGDTAREPRLEIAQRLDAVGKTLTDQNQFKDAEAYQRRALAIREAVQGPDHLDVARSLRVLAELLQKQQRASEAEPLLQRADALWNAQRAALAVKQQQMGWEQLQGIAREWWQAFFDQNTDKPEVVLTLLEELSKRQATLDEFFQVYVESKANNVPEILQALDRRRTEAEADRLSETGGTLYQQGRYQEAEELYRRALAIREQALGPDHPGTAASLNNLAVVLNAQGRLADAEALHRRALAIVEKALGPNHPDTATGLDNLATVLNAQGRYTDAEALYRRALAIREQALGSDHPDIATSLNNLATVLDDQGRWADAEALHRRALAIMEKALGPDHPDIATSLNNLATVLDNQGRWADAEALHRRALSIREKALGPDHPDTANSLSNLATVLKAQGRWADAEALHRRALSIREKALGPDHPDTANSLSNLAEVLDNQGRYADAEALHRRALAIMEKALGPDHPDTATSLSSLAVVLDNQGRYADAEALHRRALAIKEKALGPDHPGTAASLNNLATVLDDQGRWADAEALHRRALAIKEKALGPDHPATATSLSNLATVLKAQGRWADAEALHRRALAIKEKALGPNHPDTAISLSNLAGVLDNQGRLADAEALYRRALAIYTQRGQAVDPTGLMIASANYGRFMVEQNRLTEAVAPYDTAVQTLDQLFINTQGLSEEARHTFVGQYAYIYRDFLQLLLKLHEKDPKAGHDRKALEVASRQQSRVFSEMLRQAQVRVYDRDSVFQNLKTQRDDLRAQVAALTGQWVTVPVTAPEAETKKANLGRALEEKRQALRDVEERLRRDYPRFIELEQPAPVSVEALQALLQPGEAVWTVVMLPEQTALFVVTRDQFRLQPVAVSRQTLTDLVVRVRQPLEQAAQQNSLADLDPADLHQLYQHLIAPVADLLKDARRVLVVADGPLYTLPLELLVTHYDKAEARAFWHTRRDADGHSPDRALWSEYATLDYLDTHYRFQYLPSLAALVAQRRSAAPAPASPTPTPRPALLAFADPIFSPAEELPAHATPAGAPATRGYSIATQTTLQLLTRSGAVAGTLLRLPDTAEEARTIAGLLQVNDRQIYLRERAQEQTVYDLSDQGQLQGLRYLLFSTHGLLSGQFLPPEVPEAPAHRVGPTPAVPPAEPREPALALTLVGDLRGHDGFLKMGEILGLKLDTDLVVLSACNTVGEVAQKENRGEGFVGLTRAFLFAGAHRLLVSHWSVDSAASRDLMTATFTRLQAGQLPADALAEARQAVRRKTVQSPGSSVTVAYAHPLFWAPFVVVGD